MNQYDSAFFNLLTQREYSGSNQEEQPKIHQRTGDITFGWQLCREHRKHEYRQMFILPLIMMSQVTRNILL